MTFLINPSLGYFFIVVGIMFLFLSTVHPKSIILKVAMAICLVGAGYEIATLRVNPWAFLVVALSPLPFFIAIRQTPVPGPLFLVAVLMLILGAVFIFVDENNQPVAIYGPAALIAIVCASIIWLTTEGIRNAEGTRTGSDPNSVVGMLGEVKTDIEPHSAGSVLVEGELWQARSRKPIPAGSTVRILRQDGFWLTVKKVEKMTKD
ncbi:MAG TPA: NfeD family protein [Anaerolineales bacterium]|nr:NfeD family protein [Anaerolineales bacterium]